MNFNGSRKLVTQARVDARRPAVRHGVERVMGLGGSLDFLVQEGGLIENLLGEGSVEALQQAGVEALVEQIKPADTQRIREEGTAEERAALAEYMRQLAEESRAAGDESTAQQLKILMEETMTEGYGKWLAAGAIGLLGVLLVMQMGRRRRR